MKAPNRFANERAEQLSIGLESRTRPIRALLGLASLWFRPASCFGRVAERASPTLEQIDRVARFATRAASEPESAQSVVAALSALRAAATAQRYAAELQGQRWAESPSALICLRRALASRDPLVRVNAARFCARFPSEQLVSEFERCLNDPLYSVRWCAVTALAAPVRHQALSQVLDQCKPRVIPGVSLEDLYPEYWEAIRALNRIATNPTSAS